MSIKKLKALREKIKSSEAYWFESAKLEFVKTLNQRARRLGLKNKDLAGQIDASPAYISKVMRGDENLTIESMVKLVRATGGQIHFHITEVDERVSWFGITRKNCGDHTRKQGEIFRRGAFGFPDGLQRLETNGNREAMNAA